MDVVLSERHFESARRLVAPYKLNWLIGNRYDPGSPEEARAIELDIQDGAAIMVTYDGHPHGSIFLTSRRSC